MTVKFVQSNINDNISHNNNYDNDNTILLIIIIILERVEQVSKQIFNFELLKLRSRASYIHIIVIMYMFRLG